jgi:hypothetical protein
MARKKESLEVASDQLRAELIEIKERVGALETIASLSNKDFVEKYVREAVKSDKARQILQECQQAKTRKELISKLDFASVQALDFYLTPLRDDDIIRQKFNDDGTQTFEWSNLFRRLPRRTLKSILEMRNEEDGKAKNRRGAKRA